MTPTRRIETSDDVVAGLNALWEGGEKSNAFNQSLPSDQSNKGNNQIRNNSSISQLVNALVDGLNINEWSSSLSIEVQGVPDIDHEQDHRSDALQ